MKRNGLVFAIALYMFWPNNALAHHEAIFGPQSSLFLSARGYVSTQVFSRRLGSNQRTQETTALISGGITPFERVPLSFTLIVPASRIDAPDGTIHGIEDAILGARYRFDLDALKERFDSEGNFLMAMGAVELPTGSVDHDAFDGPLDYMTAVLGSIERPPFSGLAYAFYRYDGIQNGVRPGAHLLLGGGAAYTPWDDPSTERLVSFQLGLSYETYARDEVDGDATMSGGRAFLAHPTIVWGPGGNVLLFALVTLPVVQRYRDEEQEERWRVGLGAIYLIGH